MIAQPRLSTGVHGSGSMPSATNSGGRARMPCVIQALMPAL